MRSLFAAVLLACAAVAARAGAPGPFVAELDAYAGRLAALPPGDASCSEAYRALDGRDVLRVGVFLGFGDAGDLALDVPMKRALAAQLAKPCVTGLSACGFTAQPAAAPDGPAVLTKSADFGGRRTTIRVEIVDTAVDESVARCEGELRGAQEAKSRDTTQRYLKALGEDDVVLYEGHSRYGTGPGFTPLPFLSLDSVMTYVRRPLLHRMRDALAAAPRAPAVLGFLSCDSRHLYGGRLREFSPRSAYLETADLTSHYDNALAAFGFLDSVLARRCADGLRRSVDRDGEVFAFELNGLFAPPPRPGEPLFVSVLFDVAVLLLLPFLAARAARPRDGEPSFPLSASSPARDGLMLALALAPGPLLARRFSGDTAATLPFVFGLAGVLLTAAALSTGAASPRGLVLFVRRALRPWAVAAAACFLLAFLPAPGALNFAASVLRALKFAALFAAFLPFFSFAENLLLAPFAGGGAKGLAASLIGEGVFVYAVCLALDRSGARLTFAVPIVLAFCVAQQAASYALVRRGGDVTAAVVYRALSLAWLFAAGLQGVLYN